jgi:hypothetical protein
VEPINGHVRRVRGLGLQVEVQYVA